jgi:CRP-like cAMP-binding protein
LLAGLEASGVPVIERRYAPGEHPYMRGDPDEGLWFLLEGTLEVYKLYGVFSKATVRLLDDGGLFGEPSLRSEGRHRDSAEALSACRAAKVPKGSLLRLLSEDATHAPAMLCSFAGCAEEREAATERLLDREIERRMARLLLQLAGRFGEGDARGGTLGVRLSHYDLSCMVACTREAVSKAMGGFREAGLVETPRSCVVVVLDESGLRKAALWHAEAPEAGGMLGAAPRATSSRTGSSSSGSPASASGIHSPRPSGRGVWNSRTTWCATDDAGLYAGVASGEGMGLRKWV